MKNINSVWLEEESKKDSLKFKKFGTDEVRYEIQYLYREDIGEVQMRLLCNKNLDFSHTVMDNVRHFTPIELIKEKLEKDLIGLLNMLEGPLVILRYSILSCGKVINSPRYKNGNRAWRNSLPCIEISLGDDLYDIKTCKPAKLYRKAYIGRTDSDVKVMFASVGYEIRMYLIKRDGSQFKLVCEPIDIDPLVASPMFQSTAYTRTDAEERKALVYQTYGFLLNDYDGLVPPFPKLVHLIYDMAAMGCQREEIQRIFDNALADLLVITLNKQEPETYDVVEYHSNAQIHHHLVNGFVSRFMLLEETGRLKTNDVTKLIVDDNLAARYPQFTNTISEYLLTGNGYVNLDMVNNILRGLLK